jgi:hypothetical protein
MRLSFVNLAAAATITASSADPNYPASFLARPQRPFLPLKTQALGVQTVVVDLLSAQAVEGLASVHLNFTSFAWQADDAPTFNSAGGNPQHVSPALIATRNPITGRFTHLYRPGAMTPRRYWRQVIADQATQDGLAVYREGGLWIAGSLVAVPEGVLWGIRLRRVRPREDAQPKHGGWRQRSLRGDPIAHLAAQRVTQTDFDTPGLSDNLATWLELERQWTASDLALVSLADGDPSQVWIMRYLEDLEWEVDGGKSVATLEAEEVVGPS